MSRPRAAARAARSVLLGVGALSLAAAESALGATLDDVRRLGTVRCGVNTDLPGFSRRDSLGNYAGFDIDFCRAVAAAVLGDDTAFEPVPVTSEDRFEALVGGRLDVLSRNTTWTLDRDARYGVFVATSFYDGQGFMVRKSSGVRSALELDNRPICVDRGSTTELNTVDFFIINEMRYRPVYFGDQTDAVTGYLNEECEALTTDRSALVGVRATAEEPRAHELLPEVVSKEPLGPMVPANDERWEDIVRWSFHCLVNAEELGVTSENVADDAFVGTPARRRLTGEEGDAGEVLGLDPSWCARIVEQVGNYAEIYERHLGMGSSIGLRRGLNALWTNGGILYAPPIR